MLFWVFIFWYFFNKKKEQAYPKCPLIKILCTTKKSNLNEFPAQLVLIKEIQRIMQKKRAKTDELNSNFLIRKNKIKTGFLVLINE